MVKFRRSVRQIRLKLELKELSPNTHKIKLNNNPVYNPFCTVKVFLKVNSIHNNLL